MKIDLAIRDWARRDPAIAGRLRRVDNRRMGYMRSLFGALCGDEAETEAIRLHNEMVYSDPRFLPTINPTRDGLIVALKIE